MLKVTVTNERGTILTETEIYEHSSGKMFLGYPIEDLEMRNLIRFARQIEENRIRKDAENWANDVLKDEV